MHADRRPVRPGAERKDYSAVWETFYKPIGSEDCLYLNIWSPSPDATKLPVIVFIHGGSNVVGAAFDPLYVGGNLARSANAVVVTVAYRLGVMGWFSHPAFNTGDPLRDSGNFAVLDLIQSLKFVKNNIASFGGDPDNVTIMGHSAGATNVNALIVSPLAAGLFHKAVSLSGGVGGSSPAAAVNKANAFINALLIKDRLATDKASADAYRTRAKRRVDQELRDVEERGRPVQHPGRRHRRQVGHRLAHLRTRVDDRDAVGDRCTDPRRHRDARQPDDGDPQRQLQQGSPADRQHLRRKASSFRPPSRSTTTRESSG